MNTDGETIPLQGFALNPHFRENERALLHALLQATDYGILVTGLDRQDILANPRLGVLFDIAPQEIVRTDPEAVRALARRRVRDPQAFDALLNRIYTDPARVYEDEIELVTNPPRTLRRYTCPLHDREGQPIARLWTFLDITETKRLQAEVQAQLAARTQDFLTTSEVLRAMNALCRVALQHRETGDLLTAIVERTRALVGQEAAAVLLLTSEGKELAGIGCPAKRSPAEIRIPLHRDRALASVLFRSETEGTGPPAALTGCGGTLARQLRCKTVGVAPLSSEGRAFGALVLGSRTQTASPVLDRYLPAIIDQIALTLETHRLQSELQAAMETLRATQRSMVEMEKLRTAGTLAASVAHDIRNIVTAMQMELAAHPDAVSDALCDQLNRFSALTHRLLAFARPGVLETYPTSIAEVIRRMVTLVAGQAQVHGVEIVVDVPARVPLVAADASQLEHVFINLCLNAIQAMAERGGTLTLSAQSRRNWLEIAVQDTGVGIPPERSERLFDPFYTTRATGMGLGLFSCKRIVEAHGGLLTVRSAPGEGACFTVLLPTLPRRKAKPSKEDAAHAAPAAGR